MRKIVSKNRCSDELNVSDMSNNFLAASLQMDSSLKPWGDEFSSSLLGHRLFPGAGAP